MKTSKVKLWQNIRKNISDCKVSWPHSLSLCILSWGKQDDATGNNSVLSGRWAGWVIWKLLLYAIMHFYSLSPEIQPWFLALIYEPVSFRINNHFLLLLQAVFSLLTDLFPWHRLYRFRRKGYLLSLSSLTAGVGLQLIFTLLFGLFSEFGCDLRLKYKNTACIPWKKPTWFSMFLTRYSAYSILPKQPL